jgi:hypothetical protein
VSAAIPFKLTVAGLDAAFNLGAIDLNVTHVQLGSGNRLANGNETALVTPQEYVAISGHFEVSVGQHRIAAVVPGSASAYQVSEIGLWSGVPGAGGSVLAFYWSLATGYIAHKDAGIDFNFEDDILFGGVVPGNITIVADTEFNALAMLVAHEAEADPHAQYATKSGLQGQAYTAFTTTGTSTAFVGAVTPAITAYAANQRFRVKFHEAITEASTLNINALGAKSIKQYDYAGNKVNAAIAANQLVDVEYDGTDLVLLNTTTNGNGVVSKSVAGNTNVTLTATELNASVLVLTGEITGNINVIFPNNQKPITVVNSTTGAFSATCKTEGGTGATVSRYSNQIFYGDGTNLVPVNATRDIQQFTSNGTFVVPAGVATVYVSMCGGGGGGAGGDNSGYGGGGGGGARSYYRSAVTVTPGQSIAITIGAAGAAGTLQGSGSAGGTTSFGALLSASGGGGAPYALSTTTGGSAGGAGGAAGSHGTNNGIGGAGGGSFFGSGGGGGFGSGGAAAGYGAGGGGGRYASAGGAGSAGFCLVEW